MRGPYAGAAAAVVPKEGLVREFFWKTPEFQKLNSKWREKLSDSGFVDVEQEDRDDSFYRGLDGRTAKMRDHTAIRTYYTLAERFLTTGSFDTRKEKSIWELHCQGTPQRQIAFELGIGRFPVYRTIRKYRKRAGLQKWEKK